MIFGPGFSYKLGHSLLSNWTADSTALNPEKYNEKTIIHVFPFIREENP
jgi:hypothetical protein